MRRLILFAAVLVALFWWLPPGATLPAASPLRASDRIVFLGDSITHQGHYISLLEAHVRLQGPEGVTLLNLGLPSETCSGLSEPDHPFPRPDVHERLDRVLAQAKPNLVVACYGMNDGIYHPFSEERFAKYQDGMKRLIEKVQSSGARLVLLTPPPFDPLPMKQQGKLQPAGAENYAWLAIYEGYDAVVGRYAQWIKQQADAELTVVDVHGPLLAHLAAKRKDDPEFVLSGDGVHINEEGHAVLARAILQAWDLPWQDQLDPQLLALVEQRQALLRGAWLSHVGHKRPGVQAGLPLAEAQTRGAQLEEQISERIAALRTEAARTRRNNPLAPIEDQPGLPRVLLIGDSISIGYTLAVREQLQGIANVHRPATNCGPTIKGLAELDEWLGDGRWEVIHFNWGLHDLKYMGPNGENLADPSAATSRQQVPLAEYEKNLEQLVARLQQTGAALIWRTTTPVPKGARGRMPGDAARYNAAALRVIKAREIAIDDMHAYALPKLEEIQRPANVHFTAAGSRFLAERVAEAIRKQLDKEE